MKQRFASLDILKFIAISLVCSCHFLYYKDTPLDNLVAILACAGVPLFFMVNGALLMRRPFDFSKHWKRTVSMFIVLMIWKIITPVLEEFILKLDMTQYSKAQIVRYMLGEDLSGFYTGHFWFMYALLGIYLIYPMIAACMKDEKYKRYLIVLLGIIGVFEFAATDLDTLFDFLTRNFGLNIMTVTGINVFNPFGGYGYCLFFFVAGGVLFEQIESREKKIAWYIPALMAIIGWLWLFGLNRYQNTYTNAQWIVVNGYERIGTVLLSAGLFILICSYKKDFKGSVVGKIITVVSDNTMGIYYCHVIIGTYFMVIYDDICQARGITINFLKTVIFMVIALVITLIARKIPLLCRLFK